MAQMTKNQHLCHLAIFCFGEGLCLLVEVDEQERCKVRPPDLDSFDGHVRWALTIRN
jgi:hypothetical protein